MNFEVSLIVKTTAMLVVVSLLCLSLRKASASTLHAIWALALLGVLAFPVAATLLPSIDLPVLPAAPPEGLTVAPPADSVAVNDFSVGAKCPEEVTRRPSASP